MKKYIAWIVASLIVASWVFAYKSFKTPDQLLNEYVKAKCGIQEYGYSERVTYNNYKKIWDDICAFASLDIPEEDATFFADLVDEIKAELNK